MAFIKTQYVVEALQLQAGVGEVGGIGIGEVREHPLDFHMPALQRGFLQEVCVVIMNTNTFHACVNLQVDFGFNAHLSRHGVDAAKAAMFEDLARNLETPHALGMTTVLVVPEGQREVFREAWELEGRDAPYVDHLTDDLSGFLEEIVRR